MASHVPVDPTPTSLTIAPPPQVMTLDLCIGGWLHAKQGRSDSAKTYTAYRENLTQFRSVLSASGLDLDSRPR